MGKKVDGAKQLLPARFQACSTEGKTYLVLLTESRPMATEVISSRREPTLVFLSGRVDTLPSKYL